MKRIFTISLLLLSTLAFSQDYNFKPLWNKGDIKHVFITQIEREYEDGQLISDTTINNEARIEVLKNDPQAYTIEILLENQALRGIS